MRLSSISFTHASTATFGLAVACYAAARVAGYDVPHLPGHLALPAPRIIQHVPDTGQHASRSAERATGFVDNKTRHPTVGDELRTDATAVIPDAIARQVETTADSLEWSRDAQEWREDPPTGDETHPEQPDTTAPGDDATGDPAPDTTTSDDPEDPVAPAPGTTTDEEETTASSPDITDGDDGPVDR